MTINRQLEHTMYEIGRENRQLREALADAHLEIKALKTVNANLLARLSRAAERINRLTRSGDTALGKIVNASKYHVALRRIAEMCEARKYVPVDQLRAILFTLDLRQFGDAARDDR